MAIFMKRVTVVMRELGEHRRFENVLTVLEEDGTLTLERDGVVVATFGPNEYDHYIPSDSRAVAIACLSVRGVASCLENRQARAMRHISRAPAGEGSRPRLRFEQLGHINPECSAQLLDGPERHVDRAVLDLLVVPGIKACLLGSLLLRPAPSGAQSAR